jgi:hypothetical protein
MKIVLFIAFILGSFYIFSQDTTFAWVENIDTSVFSIKYKSRSIPKEFYAIIGIENAKQIASANEPYKIGSHSKKDLPNKRLNWLAEDKNKHWVLCISYSGLAHGTKYIYIDKEKGTLNYNTLKFTGEDNQTLTFCATTLEIKKHKYYWLK